MKKYKYKEYLANIVPCVFYSLLCGAFTGVVIFFFKLAAKQAEHASRYLYAAAKSSPVYVCLIFAGLVALALLMAFLHKRIPEVRGGGIPRSEGVLRGVLSFKWFRTFVGTF